MLLNLEVERFLSKASRSQCEAMGAWESGRYKTFFYSGGNQSGKTAVSARLFARHLRDKAKPGEVYWCIAPNSEKSIGTQQKLLSEIIPKWFLGDNVWTEKNGFGSKNPMLVLRRKDSKGRNQKPIVVKFKSESQYNEDPASFESETLSGVWVDEAIEQRCYSALLPRLVVKNGFMLISTIPSAGWMWETLANAPEDSGVKMVKLYAGDNPAITPQALERLKASITDPDEYEMRINGNFKMLSGIVFREFDMKRHVVKDDAIPKDLTWWGGLDSGWDHPTAFLLVGVARDGRVFIVDEYAGRLKTVKEHALIVKALIGKRKLAGPVYIDPSCASITAANRVSVLRQYSLAGLECTKARRTQDIGEKIIVDSIRQMFRDDSLFVHERCRGLIRELRIWSYKRDIHGKSTSRETYVDRDNDFIDAGKYVLGSGIRYIDPTKPRLRAIFT